MAAPEIKGTSTYSASSASTSHVITLPAVSAGDVILLVTVGFAPGAIQGAPTGYDLVDQDLTTAITRLFWKRATGAETTATVTFATANTLTAHAYVLTSDAYFAPVTTANGTDQADPPSVSAVFPNTDTTYLAIRVTADANSATAPPTGYSGLLNSSSSGSGNVTLSSAYKQAFGSTSDDPSAFTSPTNANTWVGITLPISSMHPIRYCYGNGLRYTDSTTSIGDTVYPFNTYMPQGVSGDKVVVFVGSSVTQSSVTVYDGSAHTATQVGISNNSSNYLGIYEYTLTAPFTQIDVNLSFSGRCNSVIYVLKGVGTGTVAFTTGSSASPDSPSATVSGTKPNTLAISAFSATDSSSLSVTGWPTGYDNHISAADGVSANRVVYSAAKLGSSTTENPSAFTISISRTWVAATYIVGYDSLETAYSGTPTQGTITKLGQTPSLQNNFSGTATQGTIAKVGQNPQHTAYTFRDTPTQGSITKLGQTPTLLLETKALPLIGNIFKEGLTPTLGQGFRDSPVQGTKVIAGEGLAGFSGLDIRVRPTQGDILKEGLTPELATGIFGIVTGRGFRSEASITFTADPTSSVTGQGFNSNVSILFGGEVTGYSFTTSPDIVLTPDNGMFVTGEGFETTPTITMVGGSLGNVTGQGFGTSAVIYGGATIAGVGFNTSPVITAVASEIITVIGRGFTTGFTATMSVQEVWRVTGRGFASGLSYNTVAGRGFGTEPIITWEYTAAYAEAFVMNLSHEKTPVTRYTNYPFMHVARIGNKHYGFASDGIYEISGTFDGVDTAPVNGAIITQETDFNTFQSKNVPFLYLSTDTDTNTTPIVDGVDQPTQVSEFSGRKCKLPRGSKGRYWAMKIENISNLQGLEFLPDSLQRRVK